MVFTASTLWYVDADDPAAVLREHRDPDPGAAQALAKQLFEDYEIVPKMIGTLADCAGPDADEVYIGCYPGLTVVCSRQARLPDPATLPELLVRPLASEHTYLVSFDAGMGWGSFAHWERGEFRRGFSSSRMKILADAGLPLVWERPFWAGERPVLWRADELPDPQCLPFDPPDFADEAGSEWLGFHYRAPVVDGALLTGDIAVCGFTLVPKDPPFDPHEPTPDPRSGDDSPRKQAGPAKQASGPNGRAPGRSRGLRALETGRQIRVAGPQSRTPDTRDQAHGAADRPVSGPAALDGTALDGTPDSPGDEGTTASAPKPAGNAPSDAQDQALGPRGRVLDPRGRAVGPRDQRLGSRGRVPAAQRQARAPQGAATSAPQDPALGERKAAPGDNGPFIGPQGPGATPQRRTPGGQDRADDDATDSASSIPREKERRGLLGWLRDATGTS